MALLIFIVKLSTHGHWISCHDMLAPSTAEESGRTGKEGWGWRGVGGQLSAEPYEALPESIDLLQV